MRVDAVLRMQHGGVSRLQHQFDMSSHHANGVSVSLRVHTPTSPHPPPGPAVRPDHALDCVQTSWRAHRALCSWRQPFWPLRRCTSCTPVSNPRPASSTRASLVSSQREHTPLYAPPSCPVTIEVAALLKRRLANAYRRASRHCVHGDFSEPHHLTAPRQFSIWSASYLPVLQSS